MSRPVGYAHLRDALGLTAFPVEPPALVKPVHRLDDAGTFVAVPAAMAPAPDDLLGHALFALKHEGTNLQVLTEALPRIGPEPLLRGLQETPNGQYVRLAAYLWETFTGAELEGAPPAGGAAVPVFDPATPRPGQLRSASVRRRAARVTRNRNWTGSSGSRASIRLANASASLWRLQ